MSRQDTLKASLLCATIRVTFLLLLLVLQDQVIVPMPLFNEPSAKALVFLRLDAKAVSSNG